MIVRRRDRNPHVDGCMCTFCKHHRYRDRQSETQSLAIDVMREAVDTMKKLGHKLDTPSPLETLTPAPKQDVDAEFAMSNGESEVSQLKRELSNALDQAHEAREQAKFYRGILDELLRRGPNV